MGADLVGGEALHVGERAGDGEAEGVIAPYGRARQIVDVHVAAVLVEILQDLLEDDLSFELDVREAGRGEQIAHDLESARQFGRVKGNLVERVVAAGLGVERSSHALDRVVELEGVGEARGASKQHVLDKMRQTVCSTGLVAGAHPGIERDLGGVQVRSLDGDQAEAVGKARAKHPVGRRGERKVRAPLPRFY